MLDQSGSQSPGAASERTAKLISVLMLPAWATVAISIGAALITALGALAGSYLSARQQAEQQRAQAIQQRAQQLVEAQLQRSQQLLERRTQAAFDLSHAFLKATADVKDAVAVGPDNEPPDRDTDAANEARASVHIAEAQLDLFRFLFPERDDLDLAGRTKELTDLLRDAHHGLEVAESKLKVREDATKAEDRLSRFMTDLGRVVLRQTDAAPD